MLLNWCKREVLGKGLVAVELVPVWKHSPSMCQVWSAWLSLAHSRSRISSAMFLPKAKHCHVRCRHQCLHQVLAAWQSYHMVVGTNPGIRILEQVYQMAVGTSSV